MLFNILGTYTVDCLSLVRYPVFPVTISYNLNRKSAFLLPNITNSMSAEPYMLFIGLFNILDNILLLCLLLLNGRNFKVVIISLY